MRINRVNGVNRVGEEKGAMANYLQMALRALTRMKESTVSFPRVSSPDMTMPEGEGPDAERPNVTTGVKAADEAGVPWAEWRAAELNRLFQEQGLTGQPGRITAATVRHGRASAG